MFTIVVRWCCKEVVYSVRVSKEEQVPIDSFLFLVHTVDVFDNKDIWKEAGLNVSIIWCYMTSDVQSQNI